MSDLFKKGLFGEEYFDKNYSDYDRQTPQKKLGFYRALAEAAVSGKQNPSILEIGCAFGKFLGSLDSGWRKCGMDISDFAIGRARGLVPDARFIVAGLPEMPFEESFDVIAAFDVLEHVPELDKAILSVKDRLVSGGHFIFVVPVYDGPTAPLINFLDKDITHIHRRPRHFWLDLAGAHFKIDRWWGIYRYMSPFGYLHRPTSLLRWCSPAIAVVARKS